MERTGLATTVEQGRAQRSLCAIASHVVGGAQPAVQPPALALRTLAPKGFAAEVRGITVEQVLLDEDVRQQLRQAIDKHSVLCLRFGETLDDTQLRGVIECFGPIKDRVGRCRDGAIRPYTAGQPGSKIDPQINILNTSRKADGSGGPGATNWHTDDSYLEIPCAYTSLHPQELPQSGGGATQFLNMHHAYESLPKATQRRLEGLRGLHWQAHTTTARALFARGRPGPDSPGSFKLTNLVDASHPIVRTHPRTGRKALYLNLDRMMGIEGMTIEEGARELNQLEHFAEQAGTRYVHEWQLGDVVIWDNRSVQHRAGPKATVQPGARCH